MPRARFALELPEETWIARVSAAHPDDVLRVDTLVSGAGSSVALLELSTPNVVSIVAEIERCEDVASLELLWKGEEEALIQVEMTNPVVLDSLGEAGVPLRTPFEVVDGTARWEVTTSTGRLTELGDRLDAAGIGYDLEYVRSIDGTEAESVLTDRQREVLLAAVDLGYYETPRRATLTDVAESLDVSKATASDVLHRAEGRIVDWFVETAG